MQKSNIVLIGMPGSGKSTVGIILAKYLAMDFVDTDILIQHRENCTLQDIVNAHGHMILRQIEEEVLLDVNLTNHIIATGGSAAYSEPAMKHLHKDGLVIFLHADLATLRSRIQNYDDRGLAKRADQNFEELFEERYTLYNKYSDIVIRSSGTTQEEVCETIMIKIKEHGFMSNG